MSSTSKILGNIPKNSEIPSESHEPDEEADDTENHPKNHISTPKNQPTPDDLIKQVQDILEKDLKKILG